MPINFKISPSKCQQFIDEVDDILKFAIETEENAKCEDVLNYKDVRDSIVSSLQQLIETPSRLENPLIYHVDVASMYPNIILTNRFVKIDFNFYLFFLRLTPSSVVDDTTCAACLFNRPENKCKRKMEWQWCVDYLPSSKGEYVQVRNMLERESFKVEDDNGESASIPFFKLPPSVQTQKLRSRLKGFFFFLIYDFKKIIVKRCSRNHISKRLF